MNHRDIVFKCVVWPLEDPDGIKALGSNRLAVDVLSVVSYCPCRDRRLEGPALVVNLAIGSHTLRGVSVQEFRRLRQRAFEAERAPKFFPFSKQ